MGDKNDIEKLEQALRELIALWRITEFSDEPQTRFDEGFEQASNECADDLERILAAHESRAQPDRAPDGYAYRYPWHTGGTVIRFSNGEEINGSKPLEAIPFYYGQPPAQPASVAEQPAWPATCEEMDAYWDAYSVHRSEGEGVAIRAGLEAYHALRRAKLAAAPQSPAKDADSLNEPLNNPQQLERT